MPTQVLQRPDRHGTPIALGELFILHKNRREAKASLFTISSDGRCGSSSAPKRRSCRRRYAGRRRGVDDRRAVEGSDDDDREGVVVTRKLALQMVRWIAVGF